MQTTTIQNVRKGDFFRLVSFHPTAGYKEGRETFTAQGYDHSQKKYIGAAESDISKFTYKRKDTIVSINFDY